MSEKKHSERFSAFVGIDWADAKHDICLRADGSEKLEHCEIAQKAEVIAKSGRSRSLIPIEADRRFR